jgi:predicted aspartyl protease
VARHPYDAARTPPAPVLPARIGRPGLPPDVLLVFLVDTGADLSVVPETLAKELRLPAVSQIKVRGFGGTLRPARVFAAEVEVEGVRSVTEVIGLGDSALIGRDMLNRWTVTLRGPQRVAEVTTSEK